MNGDFPQPHTVGTLARQNRLRDDGRQVTVRVVGPDRVHSPITTGPQLNWSVCADPRIEKSTQPERNLRIVEDFCSPCTLLDYGPEAAAHDGEIRANSERKGTPIGLKYLHIAGHACSESLALVTNNLKEFERVEGLRLEN